MHNLVIIDSSVTHANWKFLFGQEKGIDWLFNITTYGIDIRRTLTAGDWDYADSEGYDCKSHLFRLVQVEITTETVWTHYLEPRSGSLIYDIGLTEDPCRQHEDLLLSTAMAVELWLRTYGWQYSVWILRKSCFPLTQWFARLAHEVTSHTYVVATMAKEGLRGYWEVWTLEPSLIIEICLLRA